MEYFLKTITEMLKKNPNKIGFKNGDSKRGITYKETEDYTGRVYNYLKSKGIGKEDFVFICLPRGVRTFMAMLGIWKAGAALTIVENTYPADRVEFIKKDVNAKLVITEEVYNEMMTYDYLEGYVEADPHDACFAIYTSGSTGAPKGTLHEYGQLHILLNSEYVYDINNYDGTHAFANIAPLNFIASIGFCIALFFHDYTIHIIPYNITKNPPLFVKYLEDNKITHFFGTPTYLKILPSIPKHTKVVYTGGELVSNIYIPNVDFLNIYSCSETGFGIGNFKIDKEYDITPVGIPACQCNRQILDENGNEVPKGEKGEICVKNEFFRGYINLPEKTKEVLTDGLYHVHDIGYEDENGNLVICGRMDDMIKIDGNRIEPAEIELAIKKVLGINYCIAKGFSQSDRSFVAAYFIKKELMAYNLLDEQGNFKFSVDEFKKKLEQILPYYMIPTYYMALDEFPKNANGKLYKKALPEPNVKEEAKEYIKPTTKEEEIFCKAFEKVLKLKQVSIDDDFYLIGGDSLRSMLLVAEINDQDITITEIYRERTPRKLGKFLHEVKLQDTGNIDDRNIKALEHLQPVMGDVKWAVDYQINYPNSTMWNIDGLFKINSKVNPIHLQEAMDKVLNAHPAFSSHIIYNGDGELNFKFDPNYYISPKIIKVTKDEFEIKKKDLIKPFYMIDNNLYIFTIYSVENEIYLWFNIHHAITDGTSLQLLFSQFEKAYNDDNYKVEKDYFYLTLRDDYKRSLTKENIEIGNKYKQEIKALKELGKEKPILSVKKDFDTNGLSLGEKSYNLGISKKTISNNSLLRKYGGNVFFFTTFIKTLSIYNESTIGFSIWLNNGRDSFERMNANGLLYHEYPTSIDFAQCKDYEQALSYVNKNVQEQTANPYSNFLIDNCDLVDTSTCYIYQKNIYTQFNDGLFSEQIALEDNNKTLDSCITLQMIDNDDMDDYIVDILYSKDMLKEETIDKIFEIFKKIVKENI